MRLREKSENVVTLVTTVYDYFVNTRGVELKFSENLPCINVGRPNRPIFFPVEVILFVCFLSAFLRILKFLNHTFFEFYAAVLRGSFTAQ